MSKTAAELMAELAKNSKYKSIRKDQDKHFSNLNEIYSNDEKQLVSELNNAGVLVSSVWDLVNSKNEYLSAEAILLSHLNREHHPKIIAGIARALAFPEFAKNDELWESLVNLYRKTQSDAVISTPEHRGAQQAIAIALECLATESRVESLAKLVAAEPNADGIQWLQSKLSKFN